MFCNIFANGLAYNICKTFLEWLHVNQNTYGSYRKINIGVPLFWNTLYIAVVIFNINK